MNATKRTLLAILAMSSSTSATPTEAIGVGDISRIIGGVPAEPGEFPYFVDMNNCGGSLIAPDIVLFAAHCVGAVFDQVTIGGYDRGSLSEGAQKRFCTTLIVHPKFNTLLFNYDFALCLLDQPVFVDTSFVTLELNEDANVPSDGDDLLTMGHGVTVPERDPNFVSDILLKVTVPYVNNSICEEYLEIDLNDSNNPGYEITDTTLCAGFESEDGKGGCFGDSGGPIVKRIDKGDGSFVDIHVGLTSGGVACGVAKKPAVYARTSARLSWIKSTMCTELNSVASFCAPSVSPTQVPPSNSPTEVFSNSPTEVFSNSPTEVFSNSPTEVFSNSPTEVPRKKTKKTTKTKETKKPKTKKTKNA